MFKINKINKIYRELFFTGWNGEENSSINNLDKNIKKLSKDIELIKKYLNVVEQTITTESNRENCLGFFMGSNNNSETKLVKKSKNKQN